MTEHSENFDLNNNPLWDDLVTEAAAARARGESFALAEINDFISGAAEVQTNLWRVGANGIPHATDTVMVYTGGAIIGPEGQETGIRVGNLAQDISYRMENVVALDNTYLGRLVKGLSFLGHENYTAEQLADPQLAGLCGDGDHELGQRYRHQSLGDLAQYDVNRDGLLSLIRMCAGRAIRAASREGR